MSNFEEVIAGSATVYIAPTGTAFPDVDEAPAAAWVRMGTNGDLNYDEDGITITGDSEIEDFVPLGAIQAVKSWLTGFDQSVSFILADMTLEMLSHAYGGPATTAGNVTTVAAASGTPGYKWLSLTRTGTPTQVAMLVRIAGQSPYSTNTSFNTQIELNRVAQVASVELPIRKGEPVKTQFEYRVYRDPAGVGRIVAQTAVAA